MQAEPQLQRSTGPDYHATDLAVDAREASPLEKALDEVHRMIGEVEGEIAELLHTLAPITQPAPDDGKALRGEDPSPPRSPVTMSAVEAAFRLTVQRDRLRNARAYLDL
jgi:hypothetical protein